MNDAPLIALDGVRKTYNLGLPNETEVLHGLSLSIGRGEFAALIGPSGSGKSTLLNIVGLLERMTAGSYRIEADHVIDASGAHSALRRWLQVPSTGTRGEWQSYVAFLRAHFAGQPLLSPVPECQ